MTNSKHSEDKCEYNCCCDERDKRFAKLRELSEKLSTDLNTKSKYSKTISWVVKYLEEAIELIRDENTTRAEMNILLSDMLDVVKDEGNE